MPPASTPSARGSGTRFTPTSPWHGRAGLADPILHGTATLALSVSRLIARDLGGAAERVREIRARFTGMVALPSSFTVRGGSRDGATIAFDAVAPDGAPVLVRES